MLKIKKYRKGTIVVIQENIEMLLIAYVKLKYSAPKEVSMGFHNGSNYVYYFIVKELAEEF